MYYFCGHISEMVVRFAIAMTQDIEITDDEKVRIAKDFLFHAPPGEFNEVFNDVRVLLNNDTLLKEGCASAFVDYNKDQFTSVKLEGVAKPTLVSSLNDLGNGRFLDPRSAQSFRFDHLRKESSDLAAAEVDAKADPWRSALQSVIDGYVEAHFKNGTGAVFSTTDASGNISLTVCIEAHQFQPKNFWNGRWRSQWSAVFSDNNKSIDLNGVIKAQVHYYEDGNVQLMSSKEIKKKINVSDEAGTAKEVLKVITDEESAYQSAVSANYEEMSQTTFKALRRVLPITRSKVDWAKLTSYKVASELKPAAS